MQKFQHYHFVISWIAFMAILQLMGRVNFRYDFDVLSRLEIWRLITAHWVHLNWTHWALNSLGLLLLIGITRIKWTWSFWLTIIFIHSVVISLAFLVFNPQLKWYVGFSGVLYGLYMLASVLTFKHDKLMSSIIIAFVTLKIMAEQWMGASLTMQNLLGAPVVVDAHAYGLLCGLCLGLALVSKRINIKQNLKS